MTAVQPIVAAVRSPSGRLASLALLFALLALMFDAGRFLVAARAAIQFPWEMDYGEGIVWEQMRLMLEGRAYGGIDGLPAIVFHYPPMFHMLAAGLAAATGLDGLAAGRLVSILSTLLIALFVGLLAWRTVRPGVSARAALVSALIGGLAIFSFGPIAFWAPLMRVDMLATAFSFAGFLAVMASLKRAPFILLASVCFVAAVFTKQTSIAAPAAAFLGLLLLRPRLALWLVTGCLILGLTMLGLLAWATDGGFLRHIFLYNVNRFEAWRLLWLRDALIVHAFYIAAILFGVSIRLRVLTRQCGRIGIAALRERLANHPGDAAFLLILTYSLFAGLMTLAVAKSGSNLNYFIEWMATLSILLGVVVSDAAESALGHAPVAAGRRYLARGALIPLMIGVQALVIAPPPDYAVSRAPGRVAEMEELSAMVRSAQKPVVSDDMVMLVRSGVPVQWEPAIFAELGSIGVWNEQPFVEKVKAGHFAFFVTVGTRGERLFDSRYNPAIGEAITQAYPVQQKLAGYTLHFPARPLH